MLVHPSHPGAGASMVGPEVYIMRHAEATVVFLQMKFYVLF